MLGKEVIWLSEKTFEQTIKEAGNYLPNIMTRYCTSKMKVEPIAQWCFDNTELPVEMRIGFRVNEVTRANRMFERQVNGVEPFKFKVGKKNNRNRWKTLPYRMVKFPLIEDRIFKDTIDKFWLDKPVRFAYQNNCVGCFHRNEIMLKHMSNKAPNQFNWFVEQEQITKNTFKNGITYEKIRNHKLQLDLFDNDFNSCDSGFCGL
jgi:membrane carboxypeptidase/penicillin-binding protein PbpC